mmetsp:Transcript_26906/g.50990  ORF Transcript_26906/g.50990 Transcript_26906/m.50990 type:complete len:239 (+) Transcript_26906:103-819(+)
MSRKGRSEWESTMAAMASNALSSTSTTSARANSKKTRKARQQKARKFFGGDGGVKDESGWNGMSYVDMCRMDRLEESYDLVIGGGGDDDGDDDDDEFDEYDEEFGEKKKKRKKGPKGKKNAQHQGAGKKLKTQSLSQLLMEDLAKGGINSNASFYAFSAAPPATKPRKHYCHVTGQPTVYKDPQSGIRYSSLEALETIREKAPPWVTNLAQGGCDYFQALKEIKEKVWAIRDGEREKG